MNCRPGDTALIMHGDQAGQSVTCERLFRLGDFPGFWPRLELGPVWVVDRQCTWRDDESGKFEMYPAVPDKFLMPIRPDEMRNEQHALEVVA